MRTTERTEPRDPSSRTHATGIPDGVGYFSYFFVLLAVLFDRIALMVRFGWERVGSDDAIFWNVAADMAKGDFHEPFLYGQNYNPALESLLAVPLLWLGIGPSKAFPIITSILALLPFLAFGWHHLRRREFVLAVMITIVPLILPVEYGLMTTISRGFVTGLALFAVLPAIRSIRSPFLHDVILGTTLAMAVAINPNALVFAVPYFVWWMSSSKSPLVTAIHSVIGAIPVILALFLAMRSYSVDPDRLLHRLDDWRMVFHWNGLPLALQQLDRHFAWTCPIWWPTGSVVIGMLIGLLIVAIFHRKRALAYGLTAMLVLILLSFGFSKVHDGYDHPFFPYSRMYLALPLVLAWATTLSSIRARAGRIVIIAAVFAAPTYAFMKWSALPQLVAHWMQAPDDLPVSEFKTAMVMEDLGKIQNAVGQHPVDLVIFLREPDLHYAMTLNYAAAAVGPSLPPTLLMGKDRRVWRRRSESIEVRPNILIIGGDPAIWQRQPDRATPLETIRLHAGTAHLITGNSLPAFALIAQLGFHTD